MTDGYQLGFGDGLLSNRRIISKFSRHLVKLDRVIDWQPLVQEVAIIDITDAKIGGRPRKNPLWMIKDRFLQFLFSLSAHNLDLCIFELINQQMKAIGLMVKKGTTVDASILPSSGRPLSDKKREKLAEQPSAQIDTDATSTKSGGSYYFGYKGHIGVDIESKLIRKATFTPANVHDSRETKTLISYDEKALFGDKSYVDGHHNYSARHYGWYYGVLDKAIRSQPLSSSQKNRNRQLSSVREAVENPLGWMKTKAKLVAMRVKNQTRNRLRFLFACIGLNLNRAGFLLEKSRSVGSVVL